MILLGAWTLANAVVAWVMRGGYVTGTPEQLRQWTIDAFLGVSLFLAFIAIWYSLLFWLDRVKWFNRTGGVLPRRTLAPKQLLGSLLLVGLTLAWTVVGMFLGRWLVSMLWPAQPPGLWLFIVIWCAPLLPAVVFRAVKHRAPFERVRQEWMTASGRERALKILALVWAFGFPLWLLNGGRRFLRWGIQRWFPIPSVLLFWIFVQAALTAGIAFSVRRR
jgi:hypothetical protein